MKYVYIFFYKKGKAHNTDMSAARAGGLNMIELLRRMLLLELVCPSCTVGAVCPGALFVVAPRDNCFEMGQVGRDASNGCEFPQIWR